MLLPTPRSNLNIANAYSMYYISADRNSHKLEVQTPAPHTVNTKPLTQRHTAELSAARSGHRTHTSIHSEEQ
jgi:hypothetical protein